MNEVANFIQNEQYNTIQYLARHPYTELGRPIVFSKLWSMLTRTDLEGPSN